MFIERTSVGLDVHARSVQAAAIDTVTGELVERTVSPVTDQILAFVDELAVGRGPVRVTYEAGPSGYGLARALLAAGQACQVAAPSKLLRPAGDRVKTDRRDALLLARLARNDDIVAVTIPSGHHANRGLTQPGDPEGLDQPVHPPGRDPQQVARRHHTGQRRLRPGMPRQEPLREERALPQFRDRDIYGADPSIQVPMPVPITPVQALRRARTVLRPTHRVRLRGQDRVDERGQHLPHQVRARLRELFVQKASRVDTGWNDGHRDHPFESAVKGSLEGCPVTVVPSRKDTTNHRPRTPTLRTQLEAITPTQQEEPTTTTTLTAITN